MVWGPRASTLLVLLAPSVFWENRAFCINSEDFPESWISAQKRDTRAILLKTTLVRVSCIQNTQIRGKTIAKVFGKVDTFWTYQTLPPSRNSASGPETWFWHSAGTGNWRGSSPPSQPTPLHRPSMFPPSMCEQFPRCRLKGMVGIG